MTTNAHPVLELLRQRGRDGSRPGSRHDGNRLGLAVEGGGMRGVVSAGMATALEALNLRDAFDVVFGISAGALNGACFVAGQATSGTNLYYKDVNNPRFIALRRLVGRHPVLSLSYLLDEVISRRQAIDWRKVLASTVPLKVIATSLETQGAHVFEDFRDRDHLFAALRATCTLPLIAGPPTEVDGKLYLDPLLVEPVPYRSLLADGCSHVLVLLCRPQGFLRGSPSFLARHVVGRWIAAHEPRLREVYLEAIGGYDREVERLHAATLNPQGPPYAYAVSLPPTAAAVKTLEKDPAVLKAAAADGVRALLEALGDSSRLDEIVARFEASA